MIPPHVKVAITRESGPVEILHFFTVGRSSSLPFGAQWRGPGLWWREPTEMAIAMEVAKATALGPKAVRWRVIGDDVAPSDRQYRDAWIDDGAKIVHHMPKAREIHLAQVREVRDRKLAELDQQFMRALEKDDKQEQKRVAAEKQALRDLPATIDVEKAATVEDLKALWPANLPKI